jgi:PAS domain-containing protein
LSDDHGIPVVALRDRRVQAANGAARRLFEDLEVGAPVEPLFDRSSRRKLDVFLREAPPGTGVELEVARADRPPDVGHFFALDMGDERLLVGCSSGMGYTEQMGELLMSANARLANIARELVKAKDAEQRFRTWLHDVIDQMPDGVLLYDKDGHLKATNRGATALSCEDPERLDPFGNAAVIELRALDGSALPESRWPLVRVLRNHEAIVREEMLVRRRNGDLIPVALIAASVRDAAGDVSGAMVIVQDISDRKALERLREEWAAALPK